MFKLLFRHKQKRLRNNSLGNLRLHPPVPPNEPRFFEDAGKGVERTDVVAVG
jgi:hypothetical protein